MRRDGFSLVEMTVVLMIVAMVLSSLLPAVTEGTKIKATQTTTQHMEAIEEAIQAYYATNSVLPCPADITLAVNVTNFGRRAANANCNGGTPDANFGPVGNVTGGGVPTKDLGLPDEYAFDGWGRRIAYHVDTRATVVATFNTAGAITVNDDAGTARATTGVYALISSGRNGHGGYTRGGAPFNSGSTNAHELENCERGGAPCAGAYDATFVQKMEKSDSAAATDKFDDIVIYKLLGHLTAGGGGGGGVGGSVIDNGQVTGTTQAALTDTVTTTGPAIIHLHGQSHMNFNPPAIEARFVDAILTVDGASCGRNMSGNRINNATWFSNVSCVVEVAAGTHTLRIDNSFSGGANGTRLSSQLQWVAYSK